MAHAQKNKILKMSVPEILSNVSSLEEAHKKFIERLSDIN